MKSDDLSSLFAPNPRGAAMPSTYRVGVLLAFDPDDGSNQVVIGTSTLIDLPLLVTGAEIGLEPGDNVLVMYLGNSAMVVGKIATVGGPNYGLANAGKRSVFGSLFGWGTSAGETALVTDTSIVVPQWAHSISVNMVGSCTIHNNSASLDNIGSQAKITGLSGRLLVVSGEYLTGVPIGFFGSAHSHVALTLGVIPGETLKLAYSAFTGGSWPTDAASVANMSALVEFFRESD